VVVPEILVPWFASNIDSVLTPKILELFWVKQRFCDRSRNSGIEALDQPEILWSFQKLWKVCFGTNRDSVVARKFWTRCFGLYTEIQCPFQKFWKCCFGSNRDSGVVQEILESMFWIIERFCVRFRNSGLVVLGHQKVCGRSRHSGIYLLIPTDFLGRSRNSDGKPRSRSIYNVHKISVPFPSPNP
jgi:hypothetical protein